MIWEYWILTSMLLFLAVLWYWICYEILKEMDKNGYWQGLSNAEKTKEIVLSLTYYPVILIATEFGVCLGVW